MAPVTPPPAWRPRAVDILRHAMDDRPEQALAVLNDLATEHGSSAVTSATLWWIDQALAALRRIHPGATGINFDLRALDEPPAHDPEHAAYAAEDARLTWAAALIEARGTSDHDRQHDMLIDLTPPRVVACLRICAALLASIEVTA